MRNSGEEIFGIGGRLNIVGAVFVDKVKGFIPLITDVLRRHVVGADISVSFFVHKNTLRNYFAKGVNFYMCQILQKTRVP